MAKTENDRNILFYNLLELQNNLQKQVKDRTRELEEEKNNSEKLLIEVTQALATTIDAMENLPSRNTI